jgi:hypothetical protein
MEHFMLRKIGASLSAIPADSDNGSEWYSSEQEAYFSIENTGAMTGSAELADPVIIVRRACGHSLYVAVGNGGPAPDSLIRRINSLMARINSLQGRINSLQGRIKFPVPMRRELGRKPLNSAIDFEPIVALGGLDEQNSLYFPS